jgi:hypothetical protein
MGSGRKLASYLNWKGMYGDRLLEKSIDERSLKYFLVDGVCVRIKMETQFRHGQLQVPVLARSPHRFSFNGCYKTSESLCLSFGEVMEADGIGYSASIQPLMVSTEIATSGFLKIFSNAILRDSVPPALRALSNRFLRVGVRLSSVCSASSATA